MTKKEQRNLVDLMKRFEERKLKAAKEANVTSSNFRLIVCDTQANVWDRAASDLAEVLGLEAA